jgi:hypothetical protein
MTPRDTKDSFAPENEIFAAHSTHTRGPPLDIR